LTDDFAQLEPRSFLAGLLGIFFFCFALLIFFLSTRLAIALATAGLSYTASAEFRLAPPQMPRRFRRRPTGYGETNAAGSFTYSARKLKYRSIDFLIKFIKNCVPFIILHHACQL